MIPLRSFVFLNGFFFVLLSARTVVSRVVNKDNLDGVVETQDDSNLSKVPFRLEETYTSDFLSHPFNGTWTSETTILYMSETVGEILQFDVVKQQSSVIIDVSIFDDYLVESYLLSPTGRFLLIGYDLQKGFRYSTFMRYIIYDIELGQYDKIGDGMHIALVKWAPLTDDLIYILDNDIYYKRFSNNGFNDVQRVTDDGIAGIIYNGVADWVYEEEVLHGSSAIWFSPNGNRLAYATFDDRKVHEILYLHYGEPGSLGDQYPTEVKIKYPKAGTPNPVVSLTLVDLHDPTLNKIDLEAPIDIVGTDNVLTNVQWKDFNTVIATWSNRVQNETEIVWYNTYGETVKTFHVAESEGWVDIKNLFFYNGSVYMRKLQQSGTKAGRFHHVTRYEEVGSTLIQKDLTPGAIEVQDIRAIDHFNGRIYYLASGPGEPSQRNLYSVPADGSKEPTCISCNVLTPEGNACKYADVSFSPLRSYYVLICQGPDPTIIDIFNSNHRKVYSWENNLLLRRKLARRELPIVKDLYVRANGYDSKVRLFLPHNFDESKSYPMLVNVYAGPNTAKINDAASYSYQSYMATNRSVIYAYIDGRGSSNKGSKMLFEIYRNLGTVEVEDQITVTRKLQEMYPWIDSKRTGIWGWSYGGFSTAMVLAKDTDSVFKCGISVAPVSSWIYYDSVYTERFMGLPTPEDNLKGYNETDISRRVEGIRGKKFMLIHGTGDDNVHYQQSLALAKSLEESDILFEQITYTDEAHALYHVLPHLYHSMDRFWSECFSWSNAH
ncbi:venom dipeptidyl peptidase 4 isoform X1 [Polistes fuscatus]|uniref:venom dipeptidyl peptidase 4 isoform X1 n=2 Tax=Polistes fuscatus TaxID=30207 RepID=UPI001CA7E572|nr:venom dipeptidyl peptidase 4 isoform X1 [Polistes fuscatus]XP_043501997.1 venom dipeptidyl peptidase 4 isoform X1 [Polistes fuscatus]